MDGRLQLYRTTDTLGKSQVDLILQVYDAALKSLQELGSGDLSSELAEHHLVQVRKLVTHLYTTLDFTQGGELAAQLGQLYTFVLGQLDLVAATRDRALIEKLSVILRNLRDGWATLRTAAPPTMPSVTPIESLQVSA